MKTRSRNVNEKKQIFIFGDSISRGVTYDEGKQRYVRLDKDAASLVGQRLNATITNLSRFGNTVQKAKNYFEYRIDKERPDIVVIELGGNDCDFDWRSIAEQPTKTHHPHTTYDDFERTIIAMVDKVRKYGAAPVLATLAPLDPIRYFGWVSRFDDDAPDRIMEWLGDESRMYWWQERYNSAVLSAAWATDCPVLDLRSAFLKTPDYRHYFCIDGIHPNAYGHKLMANSIIRSLRTRAPQLLA